MKGRTVRLAVAGPLVLLAAGVLTLGIVVRTPLLNYPLAGLAANEDATSHVVATMLAYGRTPIATHKFVPLFTLGRRSDKFIDDLPTAARFDGLGNLYYTSWPPGMFAVPYLISRGLGFGPSPLFLRCLNLLLQILCCGLIACLCFESLRFYPNEEARWVAASIGFLLYASVPEAMKSHLFAYWAEALFAPLFLYQLILFSRKQVGWVFFLLVVAGGLIDWNAYIANTGFILWFLYRATKDRRTVRSAVLIICANVLALLLLVAWFTSVVPWNELISAQRHRALFRSIGSSGVLDLVSGYIKSLGPFFPLPLAILLCRRSVLIRSWGHPASRKVAEWKERSIPGLMFVASFPLVENLILLDHATLYSYDRLKLFAPLAVGLSYMVGRLPRQRSRLLVLTSLLSVTSIGAFALYYRARYSALSDPDLTFQQRFGDVVRRTAPTNALLFSTEMVRGHTIYYADHNMYSVGEPEVRPPAIPIEDYVRHVLHQRDFSLGIVYLPSRDRRSTQIWYVPSTANVAIRRENVQISP